MDSITSSTIHDNSEDIIFQGLTWNVFNDITDDGEESYAIRIFGMTKDKKNIYVKVNNFCPYFYVKIPDNWRRGTIHQFVNSLKTKVAAERRDGLKTFDKVTRSIFRNFSADKKHSFLRLFFKTNESFDAYKRALIKYEFTINGRKDKYETFESNIDPLLRFQHTRDILPSGWIRLVKSTYQYIEIAPSTCEINVQVQWTKIEPVDDVTISPFKIASFDIECVSSDKNFPNPKRIGDKIIQIGITYNLYGETDCNYQKMLTLDTCDNIDGVDVESFKTEEELLLAFTRTIRETDPDIITGYNINGFDYWYMVERSKLLGIFPKFSKCSRLNDHRAEYVEKELSSSALGKNNLRYLDMIGRINIDMYNVIRNDPYISLSSYKLDYVASQFIKGSVSETESLIDNRTLIYTNNTYGLTTDRYIKISYNDKYSDYDYKDGKKFKILELTDDTIVVDGVIDFTNLQPYYKKYWSQAKDDMGYENIPILQKGTSADRALIAKYCLQDCLLCNKLMDKLHIITNGVAMSNVTCVPLEYIFIRGQGIRVLSIVAKECKKRDYVIPLLSGLEYVWYEGAMILRPNEGIYKTPIPVLDYASLYPSSMIHRNISNETIVTDPAYDNLPNYKYYTVEYYNEDYTEKTTVRFAKKLDDTFGILPTILKDLLGARKAVKGRMSNEENPFNLKILDGLQLAYKLTCNSVYGQLGTPFSKICYVELAAATTSTGRDMLNCARIFIEYMLPPVLEAISNDDYEKYERCMNMLLNNEIDELLGRRTVMKMKNKHYKDNNNPSDELYKKKPVDYFYTKVFHERDELKDSDFVNKRKNINNRAEFITNYYQEMKQYLQDMKTDPECVYGDTDSVFIDFKFKYRGDTKCRTDKEILLIGIKVGILVGNLINILLPYPQDLEYEKTFFPFIQLSKKRYSGNLYEFSDKSFYQKNMGNVLKRRDNAPIVKIVIGGLVDRILNGNDIDDVKKYLKSTLKGILGGKYSTDKFIVSKTLKDGYVDRSKIVHAALADKMAQRGDSVPQMNDRVPFVYIETNKKGKILQGEKVEHPDYLEKYKKRIDYRFYITNQIKKPAMQFLQHVMDDAEGIFDYYLMIEQNRRDRKIPIIAYNTVLGTNYD